MMNSETSTNAGRKRRQGQAASRRAGAAGGVKSTSPVPLAPKAADTGGLRPLHLLIIATFGAASAAALAVHGTRPANVVFIVLAVLAAGVTALALYRTLWPLASEVATSQPEMVGGRTRAALEREKTIVLRAIKELEFDRAMGKVSEADCEEMIGRLRGRAVRLIRQLDAGSAGYRELIERELNARLGVRPQNGRVPSRISGATPMPAPSAAADHVRVPGEDALDEGEPGSLPGGAASQATEPMRCGVCGVTNDPDARFCKSCGTKLGVPA